MSGLTDEQVKQLCEHLGHDERVHKQYYRGYLNYSERFNIGKLFVMQDLNVLQDFQNNGQFLDDVKIDGNHYIAGSSKRPLLGSMTV